MKTTVLALVALFAAGAALPAMAQTAAPRDTGNMAYPTPLPQGTVGSTSPVGRDTGNMAYPASPGNIAGSAPSNTPGIRPGDTNGAQYQAPTPQGNVSTTVVK